MVSYIKGKIKGRCALFNQQAGTTKTTVKEEYITMEIDS